LKAVVDLVDITKHYKMGEEDVPALSGIQLRVEENEYLAVIGASGSGKSTMLNILGCLDSPSAGRYMLNGADVSKMTDSQLAVARNRDIGFIFQSFNLLPRATALQNVIQPLLYRDMKRADRIDRAREVLAHVGLAHRLHHLPSELSGGQRQRVAVARALSGNPALLLADEPTGNLDSATSAEIMALFDQLHAEGHTLIIVSHERSVAARCRRSVTLADGLIVADRAHRLAA
jgi:putative ABC transport system ATP-binding protein